MLISQSCSWCGNMVPSTARSCAVCGHDSGPRMLCQCPPCARARRRAMAASAPVPLDSVIAEALAALRRGDARPLPQPEEDDMTRKRKTVTAPDPAPVPRDAPRTAVPAKLADIIRALDDCLLETYGPHAAFAYHLWVGDGLAAASNSTFGYVPPIVKPAGGRPEPNSDGGSGTGEGGDAK